MIELQLKDIFRFYEKNFPHGDVSKNEIEVLLQFAIEGRKRVKDQLVRIDSTYNEVRFGYEEVGKNRQDLLKTLEDRQYPQHCYQSTGSDADGGTESSETKPTSLESKVDLEVEVKEQHLLFYPNS